MQFLATSAFGLEAVVSRELKQLGYHDQTITDGRVRFVADESAIARCNLWLRSADRLLIEIGRFPAVDFGQLFDRTTAIPWDEWIPRDASFPVRGRSVRSQLHSVPDCQAIVKKAIVERLKKRYRCEWFDETGPEYGVDVSLLQDEAVLTLDTTGPGLHKRGYRTLATAAPLKETLAAGLIQLSYWNRNRPLIDPCCGSGTILIEAAWIARNRAPGLMRSFSAEKWSNRPSPIWDEARAEANDLLQPPADEPIIGYDIDARVLGLARQHAEQAAVAGDIHFQQQELSQLSTRRTYGCVIVNPPYGERMGDDRTAEEIALTMRQTFASLDTWSLYVLTADSLFEKRFGRQATRRRKLFNGQIACTYYQFVGPRPPRQSETADEGRGVSG